MSTDAAHSPHRAVASHPPSPLPPASPDYVLSLSAHRDLSRRRHEEHDLSWCREQLALLSSNLKSRLHQCSLREQSLLEAEIGAGDRLKAEVVHLSSTASMRIKTEYEKRLGKFERVVSLYGTQVKNLGDRCEELERSVAREQALTRRLGAENGKLKGELERYKKRADILDWKDMKRQQQAGQHPPPPPSPAATPAKHPHTKQQSPPAAGTPPATAKLRQARDKLSITDKQTQLLTMGFHGVLHVLAEEARRGQAREHKDNSAAALADHRSLCPQILPSLLHLVSGLNASRGTQPASSLLIKERNAILLVSNVAHFPKAGSRGGDSVVARAPYVICNREHVYDATGAGAASKESDLGFLSSSCPTVRLTASLVILRLLFNSPPTSTVHNITPTELTKLASSMVAAECSGDCIGFFVSVGGLSTTWGMLRVSDYEVVMAGVKTLLYVVQACNDSRELKFQVCRWCCEDSGFEGMVAGVFEEDSRLKDAWRGEVREVAAILLQIVCSSATQAWRRKFRASRAGDVVKDAVWNSRQGGDASLGAFAEGNVKSALEYLSSA
ncbi:hypothetical protein TeGR_g12106 [Tetraparma gracilis]|uniref:Uncharacterized protein n=1 Tax=Tetraparma gracilis TaxID=2962635 RepID=A0ABQ6M549_9STRA|nr:hypothetical protein TeGR_g12106 [Tetraparma gracilis]